MVRPARMRAVMMARHGECRTRVARSVWEAGCGVRNERRLSYGDGPVNCVRCLLIRCLRSR